MVVIRENVTSVPVEIVIKQVDFPLFYRGASSLLTIPNPDTL